MKKLLRNIALLLIPIVLYYVVFLAFEPNNYFGLRSETPSGAVFGAIRSYQKNPTNTVIFGDSRLAHINMEIVNEAAGAPGRQVANLAFMGASLKEELDELDWILARYPAVDEVVFGISFYTLNENYAHDRFGTIEKGLYNPFAYLTNLSYNLESLQNLVIWAQGGVLYGGEGETQDPATYTFVPYTEPDTGNTVQLRDRFVTYMGDIAPNIESWRPNEALFRRLLETIATCRGRGIRFVVVLPPVHDTVYRYHVQRRGIDDVMAPLLRQLQGSGAEVFDYEFTARPDYPDDWFFDGLHLDYVRGLPVWTREVFTEIAQARTPG